MVKMQESNEDFNLMYSFLRSAVVSFYNKCNENSYNSYYSRFLDQGFSQEDYLEFVEILYKNLYEDYRL